MVVHYNAAGHRFVGEVIAETCDALPRLRNGPLIQGRIEGLKRPKEAAGGR